ncbi:glycoside hydrolase family 127 protein [Cellulosilyticum sp. I15G10I2]|uniref:glycoside hydrolase family 127 protein n=1 Tax=Cellulosilyticum sp. I15G10I2 TaxID=1892843 RepID=UPI00085C846A|nr:beta-L-arabinofuranosidase domain-containing protein [Cellulosilyticum sp. I15G10I2]
MYTKNFSKPLDLRAININDSFWKKFLLIAREHVIPYQWEALNDRIEGAEPSYCMRNFKIAAGMMEGEFGGCVFQDSDFGKWIEAVGYALMWHPDVALQKIADEAIDIVCAAQQPDGYLNTYYIINGLEKRWTNLRDNHELYCAGHLLEGAIAYYIATGKDKLLNTIKKYIDYIAEVFGTDTNLLPGYPGHEIIEMALVKLYNLTDDIKYLNLAKYFIDQRGQSPLYFEAEGELYNNNFHWKDSYFKYQYYQAGLPVREQTSAEGHAVRAAYLYSGMADVARETNDQSLLQACETLWLSIVNKQMYITGAIGSSAYGEAFTYDYDLPNDTIYAETCAAIGLVFFAKRMLEISPISQYADVMEKALYNGIISGMSLDGEKFFYVNPLEVVPEASEKDHLRRHVKVERQKWFGCACCPPNVARLLTSLASYCYTQKEDTLFMHLYVGGNIQLNLGDQDVCLGVRTHYPWDEEVSIGLTLKEETNFTIAIRIPAWCNQYMISVNGCPAAYTLTNGYAYLERKWHDKDEITIVFEMPVRINSAHPNVRENIGKVAITRGPIVYCLEEADNGKGLHRVCLGSAPDFTCQFEEDLLGGVVTITSSGQYLSDENWDASSLYHADITPIMQNKKLKWIPYYTWANRTPGEMLVWVRR